MTLDEAIKHAEEVAKQNEEDAVIYSNCKNHKKNLYEIGLAENAEKKCCKCSEEHRQLAEWLKELKRLRKQARWIPCKEHLPKNVDDYLVTTHSGQIARYIYMGNGSSKDYWMRCVLAWMPLPEPYKEHDDD